MKLIRQIGDTVPKLVSAVPTINQQRAMARIELVDGKLAWRGYENDIDSACLHEEGDKERSVFNKADIAFAKNYGNQDILGQRYCWHHGFMFTTLRHAYLEADVLEALQNRTPCKADRHYNVIRNSVRWWPQRLPKRPTMEPTDRDVPSIMRFCDKVLRLAEFHYHQNTQLWEVEDCVHWALSTIIRPHLSGFIWAHPTVKTGPNKVNVGDPVRGTDVQPIGRIVTIYGMCFLDADILFREKHRRFPWESEGMADRWSTLNVEVNWDD